MPSAVRVVHVADLSESELSTLGIARGDALPEGEWFVRPDAQRDVAARMPRETAVVGEFTQIHVINAAVCAIVATTSNRFTDVPAIVECATADGDVIVTAIRPDRLRGVAEHRRLLDRLGAPNAVATECVGVGIVGYGPFGGMGYTHGLAATETDGLRLVGVCDSNAERRAAALADFPHLHPHVDIDSLCADDEVDVAIVATPPVLHAPIALALLRAGKHVVVEKPMCLTAADADMLLSEAAAVGRTITVHQSRRWDGDYLALRRAIDAGTIGEVFNMETFVGSFEHPCRWWHSDEALSGGAVYDWGSHHIDWILQIFGGPPDSVRASSHKRVWRDVTNSDRSMCRCAGPTAVRRGSSRATSRPSASRSSSCKELPVPSPPTTGQWSPTSSLPAAVMCRPPGTMPRSPPRCASPATSRATASSRRHCRRSAPQPGPSIVPSPTTCCSQSPARCPPSSRATWSPCSNVRTCRRRAVMQCRVPEPMGRPIAIGVLGGTSWIATEAVIPAIHNSVGATVGSIGSRSGSIGYADVLADPAVDAVYIALPNGMHCEWVLAAAAAGKHVLCEKPLGVSQADVRVMSEACDAAGVLLVEAYMTPFHPRSAAIDACLRSGELGEIRHVDAAFTFCLAQGDNYRWAPEHGGGALLDVGIYCLSPIVAAMGGAPSTVAARVTPAAAVDTTTADTTVDATTAAWLGWSSGATASVLASFELPERQALVVCGTGGTLTVDRPFTPGVHDTSFTITRPDGEVEHRAAAGGNSYLAMVEAFAAAVRADAPWPRPVTESIIIAELCDRIRAAASGGAT